VFIPDDLLVTDLFKKLPEQSLFIWYPQSNIPSMSRARLDSIYDSISVQRICKSVMKNDSFTLGNGHFRTVNSSKVIKVGLLCIILAFLADPALDIPAEGRHRMVSCLLNVTVQENDEPITVGYSLSLSSGKVVDVNATRMLRWERENSMLYLQSSNGESSYKEKIEFATYFAEELSKGLLFEMPDKIPYLADLIKFGSLLDFDDAAIEFLHKSNNLQLFPEDEDFLKSSLLGLCPEKLNLVSVLPNFPQITQLTDATVPISNFYMQVAARITSVLQIMLFQSCARSVHCPLFFIPLSRMYDGFILRLLCFNFDKVLYMCSCIGRLPMPLTKIWCCAWRFLNVTAVVSSEP